MSRATSPKNYFVFKARGSRQSVVAERSTYEAAAAVANKAAKSDDKCSYRVAMVTEVFQQAKFVEVRVDRHEA